VDRLNDSVWCEVHGEIHDATEDPYRYGYAESGETPECGAAEWRKVWAGGYVES
jgi:hypothetical protein